MELSISMWAALSFVFASYSVVGNDSLETLGTYITSNRRFHWTFLYFFVAVLLFGTFFYMAFKGGGDVSGGVFSNTELFTIGEVEWYHALAPVILLVFTRVGFPISTEFIVLSMFTTAVGLTVMLEKSIIGYSVGFAVGLGVWLLLSQTLERFIRVTGSGDVKLIWTVLQWVTTSYLWVTWLTVSLDDIFIFLPTSMSVAEGGLAIFVTALLLALTFANQGGPVLRTLRRKVAMRDVRSAIVVDFTFACLLIYFGSLSDTPFSTTWVFIGLLGGRSIGFALTTKNILLFGEEKSALVPTPNPNSDQALYHKGAVNECVTDLVKAWIGLAVAIDLALLLPIIAAELAGNAAGNATSVSDAPIALGATFSLIVINAVGAIGVAYLIARRKRPASLRLLAVTTIALVFSMTVLGASALQP